ncbi:MAG: glycogen/starch synthase [Dechloromonas sp.]|nr:glycogen/starch synthase [Candidatus Dechloromonas phosphoritropha]
MNRLSILFATSEMAPWVKTGGLGDVAAALPAALRRARHDVRVLIPRLSGNAHSLSASHPARRTAVACPKPCRRPACSPPRPTACR